MFRIAASVEGYAGTSKSATWRAAGCFPLRHSVLQYRVILIALLVSPGPAAWGQAQPSQTPQKCRELLEEATKDKNPDIRKAAVEALSLTGTSDPLFDSLASMAQHDPDVLVRTSAVTTLADLKSKSTVPILKRVLDDPVPEVSLAAAKALYRLHEPEGTRFLLAVASGESKGSSSYLSQQERGAVRLLHTPTKLFTMAAINAVGFVPLPGLGLAVSSAQGIMSQPDSSARAAALLLLGNDRDPALASVVESDLSDKEWSVRAAAIHVAAMHPYPALREDLVVLLDDKKPAVRLRAAAGYIRLGSDTEVSTRKPKPAR